MVATVRTLFDEAEIAARVAALAAEIAAALPAEFTIVGVLKGSFVFVADLVRALARHGRAPRIEFIRLGSYGGERDSSGSVTRVGPLPEGIAGRPVLLIDDIVDTGHTLAFAKDLLVEHGATRVWTCALIDKPSRRRVPCTADFVGFTVADLFVVGYGIDYAEQHRELPYVGTVD